MPTYEVRVYWTYYDAYQVQAASAEEAEALVNTFRGDTATCFRSDEHVGEEVCDVITEALMY